MHQQDIMTLYSIIFSRIGWFIIFVIAGLGWAYAINLWHERQRAVKKLGLNTFNWIIKD